MVWAPVLGVFNVRTSAVACDCKRGLYGYRKRTVCTESWPWEKNPLPHLGLELGRSTNWAIPAWQFITSTEASISSVFQSMESKPRKPRYWCYWESCSVYFPHFETRCLETQVSILLGKLQCLLSTLWNTVFGNPGIDLTGKVAVFTFHTLKHGVWKPRYWCYWESCSVYFPHFETRCLETQVLMLLGKLQCLLSTLWNTVFGNPGTDATGKVAVFTFHTLKHGVWKPRYWCYWESCSVYFPRFETQCLETQVSKLLGKLQTLVQKRLVVTAFSGWKRSFTPSSLIPSRCLFSACQFAKRQSADFQNWTRASLLSANRRTFTTGRGPVCRPLSIQKHGVGVAGCAHVGVSDHGPTYYMEVFVRVTLLAFGHRFPLKLCRPDSLVRPERKKVSCLSIHKRFWLKIFRVVLA